jgi:hypothetical protein
MPHAGGRYRVVLSGRFDGRLGPDLLSLAQHHAKDAALVIGDADFVRVLYFQGGLVVGADSDVIFERLGRTLLRRGALAPEDAARVIELEETAGKVAAAGLLSREVLEFGLERSTWDIGTALPFLHGAHFLLVSGTPDLGSLPRTAICPTDLAIEGVRRYDEWRNGRDPAPVSAARSRDTEALPDRQPRRARATAASRAAC